MKRGKDKTIELEIGDDIEFTFYSGKKQSFKITNWVHIGNEMVCNGINLSGNLSRCYLKISGRVATDQNGKKTQGKA